LAAPISFQLSGGFAAPYPLTVDRFRNNRTSLPSANAAAIALTMACDAASGHPL
jgi:hypothetical protein